MDFAFSEEQDEFREVVRRFLEEKAPAASVRQVVESPDGFDRALWKQMAEELGLQGVHLPECYGGQGAGFLELGIVLEEMGRVLLPGPFLGSAVLATSLVLGAASEEQRERLLPRLARGEIIAALALAEDEAGFEPEAIRLEAAPEGKELRLSGAKTLVLDAQAADFLLVAARLPQSRGEQGLTVALVEAGAAGLAIQPQEPLDTTRRLARVEFDGVHATPLGVAGEAGPQLRRSLAQGAIGLTAEMVGGAARCLEMAVDYAKVRVQFGRPIGSFQAIKHKAAEMLLDLELARAAAYWAWWVADLDRPELALAAHLAKATCADSFRHAAAECIQIHGGIGFTWEHEAHLYYKRATASDVLLGDAPLHRAGLARELGLPTPR